MLWPSRLDKQLRQAEAGCCSARFSRLQHSTAERLLTVDAGSLGARRACFLKRSSLPEKEIERVAPSTGTGCIWLPSSSLGLSHRGRCCCCAANCGLAVEACLWRPKVSWRKQRGDDYDSIRHNNLIRCVRATRTTAQVGEFIKLFIIIIICNTKLSKAKQSQLRACGGHFSAERVGCGALLKRTSDISKWSSQW